MTLAVTAIDPPILIVFSIVAPPTAAYPAACPVTARLSYGGAGQRAVIQRGSGRRDMKVAGSGAADDVIASLDARLTLAPSFGVEAEKLLMCFTNQTPTCVST